MGGRELFDFLLNMEGVGEGGLIAIGEGILTDSQLSEEFKSADSLAAITWLTRQSSSSHYHKF